MSVLIHVTEYVCFLCFTWYGSSVCAFLITCQFHVLSCKKSISEPVEWVMTGQVTGLDNLVYAINYSSIRTQTLLWPWALQQEAYGSYIRPNQLRLSRKLSHIHLCTQVEMEESINTVSIGFKWELCVAAGLNICSCNFLGGWRQLGLKYDEV